MVAVKIFSEENENILTFLPNLGGIRRVINFNIVQKNSLKEYI